MCDHVWQPGDTIPKLFLRTVGSVPNRVVMRHKKFGIWREYTWRDYLDGVAKAFYGLRQLGMKRDYVLMSLTEISPVCFFVDMAVLSAGAVSSGFFLTATREELLHVFTLTDTRFVLCEDQEQVDKVLSVADQVPTVERIVVMDPRGMWHYDDPRLVFIDDLFAAGEKATAEDLELRALRDAIAEGEPEAIATVAYSSGSTGKPKAIAHTYNAWISAVKQLLPAMDVRETDEYLSFMPLTSVERAFCQFFPLVVHNRINIVEEPDQDIVQQNIREIQPCHLLQLSRSWENMATWIRVKVDDSGWLKRKAFQTFLPLAIRRAELKLSGKPIGLGLRCATWIGDLLVFQWVRARMGMTFLRGGLTGGAAMGPDVITFFHAIGVPLRQIYGQTECNFVTIHNPHRVRAETVGAPMQGVEIKISPDGEILVRTDGAFKEYLKQPDKTAEVKRDGWLYTGDFGHLDDEGQLVLIDRHKNVVQLPDGTIFSPTAIENRLKFSPYIREAVVLGQDREFLSAMIQIDLETVGHWAERRGIAYTTFHDLTTKLAVHDLIERELAAVNPRLAPRMQVKRFALLPKELDADDDELTRTLKVKRPVVVHKFRHLWLPFYGEYPDTADKVPVTVGGPS